MKNRIQEVKIFCRKMQTVLQNVARTYTKKNNLNLKFSVGTEGSYTDHKEIVVTIHPTEAERFSNEEIRTVGRFKTGHEVMHVLCTDSKAFSSALMDIMNQWNEKARKQGVVLDSELANFCARVLVNGLEDGRIENIMVYRYPGLKAARDWYRLDSWTGMEISANMMPAVVLFNQILETATTGLKLKGFDKHFKGTEEERLHRKVQKNIARAVKASTCEKCMKEARKMADILEDYIIENVSYDANMMEELKKQLKEMLEFINENNIQNDSLNDNENKYEPENVPIIGILTDDMENSEEAGGQKPDIVIDLRTHPEEDENEDESDNSGSTQSDQSNQSEPNQSSQENNNTGDPVPQEESSDDTDKSDADQSNSTGEKEHGSEDVGSEEKTSESTDVSDTEEKSSDSSDTSSELNDSPELESSSSQDCEGTYDRNRRQEGSDDELLEKIKKRLETVYEDNRTENKKITRQAEIEEKKIQAKEKESGRLSSETLQNISDLHRGKGFSEVDLTKLSMIRKMEAPTDVKRRGAVAKNQIENIMASLSEADKKEVYEGALDSGELGRFVLGYFDVFQEDGEPYMLDTCCYLLKDNSGSMMGEKDKECSIGLAIIEEALKELMPLKISDFSDCARCEHQVIKNWDDKGKHSYSYSYWLQNRPGGSNDDAYSIDVAAEELKLRPEEHKILVIFSDGQPCCSNIEVRQVVEKARDNGIFVISFFFGDMYFIENNKSAYEDMYGKYFIGVTPENIGTEFIKFMKILISNS